MPLDHAPPPAAWPDPVRPALGDSRSAVVHETKLLPQSPVGVTEAGTFEGYASLFGVPDLAKDVVSPGAFADSLARLGAVGIRLLWQHDPAEPLGRWLSVAEDARGLHVRGRLNLAVERAREVHALLQEGAVDGLSIGYRVERARAERATGLRRLEKLDPWEISVVTFLMLPGAGERGEAGGGVARRGDPRGGASAHGLIAGSFPPPPDGSGVKSFAGPPWPLG